MRLARVAICLVFSFSGLWSKSLYAIDPNAPAASSGPVEEDLVGPNSGQVRDVKPSDVVAPTEFRRDDGEVATEKKDTGIEPPLRDNSAKRRPLPWEYEAPSDYPAQKQHLGDFEEDSGVGLSLGIGLGYRSFAANLGLLFPINRWFGWSLGGFYSSWTDTPNAEMRYGPETALVARFPWRLPLTPFFGVGLGYEKWTRKKDQTTFDQSGALYSHYFAGISIPMARHIAFDISQTWKTYLGLPPRTFDNFYKREPYGSTRFNVGFSVIF
jgi:hypothetical protein